MRFVNHRFNMTPDFGSWGPTHKLRIANDLPEQVLNNLLEKELDLIFRMDDVMETHITTYSDEPFSPNSVRTIRYSHKLSFIDFCKREGIRCYTRKELGHRFMTIDDIILDEDSVLVYEMEMGFKYTKHWRKQQIEHIHLAYTHMNIWMIRDELQRFYPEISDEEWHTMEYV